MNQFEEIKKIVPDLCKQELTLDNILPRKMLQEKAEQVADMMGTGLVAYDHEFRTLRLYTSERFKTFLAHLKPGTVIRNRSGIEFTVESEPFLCGLQMAVRVNGDTFDCYALYDPSQSYESPTVSDSQPDSDKTEE